MTNSITSFSSYRWNSWGNRDLLPETAANIREEKLWIHRNDPTHVDYVLRNFWLSAFSNSWRVRLHHTKRLRLLLTGCVTLSLCFVIRWRISFTGCLQTISACHRIYSFSFLAYFKRTQISSKINKAIDVWKINCLLVLFIRAMFRWL